MKTRISAASVGLVALLANTTQAAILPSDGSQVALPGTSVAAQPQLAGIVVADVVTPFSYGIIDDLCGETCFYKYDLSGSLQSRVVKSVDGTYDFYWRIKTLPILSRVRDGEDGVFVEPMPPWQETDLSWAALAGFSAPTYRADWRIDGLGSAAPRTAALNAAGPIFYFSDRRLFVDGETWVIDNSTLKSGGESRFFFLDTDARHYAQNATMQLHSQLSGPFYGGGGGSDIAYISYDGSRIATFGPAAIPEPQTWALMLVGLAGVVGAARRYRSS